MKSAVCGSSALFLALLLVRCAKTSEQAEKDAGRVATLVSEVADAAPVPAPVALATNEGDIARFPDETSIADEEESFLRAYNVREAPPAGAVITGLNKGTMVTKIASRDRFFLILFDDPKAFGSKQMGWVHRDAFSAVSPDAGSLAGEPVDAGAPLDAGTSAVDASAPAADAGRADAGKRSADAGPAPKLRAPSATGARSQRSE